MNKVMIVTGGSRGIGAATAMLAARRGEDARLFQIARAVERQVSRAMMA